jgi:hypothetical protein
VRESACLNVEDRRTLDTELCRDVSKLEGMGNARITAEAKSIACRLDVQSVVDRVAKAEADRTVTIRPAPDCMTYVTALLPVAQGVGVYAALKRAADTTFDDRSRGQVMADALVERVTGRPAEAPEPVSLSLVMTDEALWGQDNAPAVLDGYGPIPAAAAQRMVRDAVVDERRWRRFDGSTGIPRVVRWWRWSRDPGSSRRGWQHSSASEIDCAAQRIVMRRLVTAITPRHATAVGRRAGKMGWVCASAATTPRKHLGGAGDEDGVHTAEFVTPTGARYCSRAPLLPGSPLITVSEIEVRFALAVDHFDAA